MSNHISFGVGDRNIPLMIDRTRLIKLCTLLTSHPEAAEDLAQEVMLEVWRHLHELRNPERFQQWTTGIARNICRRWLYQYGREQTQTGKLHAFYSEQSEEQLADEYDIEVELERKELIALLDRPLALLPPETRHILLERYVQESSLATVAERLETNREVVAMRLHRGKLLLKRLLLKEMYQVGEETHFQERQPQE